MLWCVGGGVGATPFSLAWIPTSWYRLSGMEKEQDPQEAFQTQIIRALRALLATVSSPLDPWDYQMSGKQKNVANDVLKVILDTCDCEVQRQVNATLKAMESMNEDVRRYFEYKRSWQSGLAQLSAYQSHSKQFKSDPSVFHDAFRYFNTTNTTPWNI